MGALTHGEADLARPLFDWNAATRAYPGEGVSGDECIVHAHRGGVLIGAIDGLGHGNEAASAARIASATLIAHVSEPPLSLVAHCHHALIQTRGVVMSIAQFSAEKESLTWLGVGNVLGILRRADRKAERQREAILLRSGVVGFDLPTLHAQVVRIAAGDTLVFATDGIRPDVADLTSFDGPPAQVAARILREYGRDTDDALVLIARYLGRNVAGGGLEPSARATPRAAR